MTGKMTAEPHSQVLLMRLHRWRHVLFLAPVLLALLVRLGLPSFYEYESQEDTVRAMTIVEKGELPLYGIGHVRFLGAALGPLVYYFKALPYAFSPSPMGEVYFLIVLHLLALYACMLLCCDVVSEVYRDRLPAWTGTFAGQAAGVLLALSVYANALTSHAHPSYFAAVFMAPFVYAMFRYFVCGDARWLIPGGIAFGLMTQLYQLTLFAPLMLVTWLLLLRPRLTRKSVLGFLVPVVVCYLPYVASEVATGFWNTLNLFTYQPGPKDEGMVGPLLLSNFGFLLNCAVDYRGLPNSLDGFFVVFFAGGVYATVRRMWRHRALRFFGVFVLFYCILPGIFLQSPRFQLSLPAVQLLVVLGMCELGWLAFKAVREGPSWRVWSTGLLAGFVAMAGFLFGGSELDFALRRHLVYPLRIIYSEPAGRTPDLEGSLCVLKTLRTRYGVGLEQLDESVHSPVVGSGFYGHHYLMRVLEGMPDVTVGRPTEGELLVTDEYFPYEVYGSDHTVVDGRHIAVIRPARFTAGLLETVVCADAWCSGGRPRQVERPTVRFFWGCGEFRDLDKRLGIPVEECEELLTAPAHSRVWEGGVTVPAAAVDCPDCQEVVWLSVASTCQAELLLDGRPVKLDWVQVRERRFGSGPLGNHPGGIAGRHNFKLVVGECRPYYVDVVFFSGRMRQGVKGDEYWSTPRSDSL